MKPMKMPLEAWKALMRTSIDGIEGALSATDSAPQKAKLADLRKRLKEPSVVRHRKRLEDELDALVESDIAMQIASRRYLQPKVQEAVEKALVTLERVNRVLTKAAEMRKRSGKKSRSVRGLNRNHNHDLKNLFKSAATVAAAKPGPFQEFYDALVARGIRPEVRFDAKHLKPQTA